MATCLTPITIKVTKELKHGKIYNDYGYKYVKVPCGKCAECLRRRQRSWSIRLNVENWLSRSSFFVTLTYDDDHLPISGVQIDDCQRFFKRCRKSVKFRYFLVSEYGDKFHRPHYHLLMFFKENFSLLDLYRLLSDKWPYGSVNIGTVTPKSINYCTKYALKPKNQPSGQNKVFMLCSRRPGLGELPESAKHTIHAASDFKMHGFGLSGKTLPRFYRDKIFTKTEIGRYVKQVQAELGLNYPDRRLKREIENDKLIKKYGKIYE